MTRLVDRLSRLPGIGKRSAERIAFYLLKQSSDEVELLAGAIHDLKNNTRQCEVCFNLTDVSPCPICDDPKRNRRQVLVVEQPNDVATLETTGQYRGSYHVLMGRLAPLDGVGPGELNIDSLVDRVKRDDVTEVIIGTNPTIEGDGTAMYLAEQLNDTGANVSRLARGLPTGANLDMVSKAVLADAIQGRQTMGGV